MENTIVSPTGFLPDFSSIANSLGFTHWVCGSCFWVGFVSTAGPSLSEDNPGGCADPLDGPTGAFPAWLSCFGLLGDGLGVTDWA